MRPKAVETTFSGKHEMAASVHKAFMSQLDFDMMIILKAALKSVEVKKLE